MNKDALRASPCVIICTPYIPLDISVYTLYIIDEPIKNQPR